MISVPVRERENLASLLELSDQRKSPEKSEKHRVHVSYVCLED